MIENHASTPQEKWQWADATSLRSRAITTRNHSTCLVSGDVNFFFSAVSLGPKNLWHSSQALQTRYDGQTKPSQSIKQKPLPNTSWAILTIPSCPKRKNQNAPDHGMWESGTVNALFPSSMRTLPSGIRGCLLLVKAGNDVVFAPRVLTPS